MKGRRGGIASEAPEYQTETAYEYDGDTLLHPKEELNLIHYFFLTLRKTLIFLVVIFLLCIPLGDPNKVCTPVGKRLSFYGDIKPNRYSSLFGYHCVCNIYKTVTWAVLKPSEVLLILFRHIWTLFLQIFNNFKLRFYGFLNVVDRETLCKTIQCSHLNKVNATTNTIVMLTRRMLDRRMKQ